MLKRSMTIILHLVVWLLLYFLPYLFSSPGNTGIRTIFTDSGDITHLISFVFLVVYSYLNYYYLVTQVFFQRRYVIYALALAACLFVVIKVPQFFDGVDTGSHRPPDGIFNGPGLGPPPGDGGPPGMREGGHPPGPGGQGQPLLFGMNYNIILFFILTFIGLSIRYRLRIIQYEKQRLNAEVSFLKTQINPHFLFNSLNTIYSLVIEKSDEAPGALIQLSEMMRYVIKEAEADKVKLAGELKYIDNYIGLQKQRLGDTARINYRNLVQADGLTIAPLILMSFIENAFKHGVNPDEDSEITVFVSNDGAVMELTVANKKVRVLNPDDSLGLGLNNAKSRLQFLYPGKHVLQIRDEPETFTVHLKITLA
jgi:hypothetical protein